MPLPPASQFQFTPDMRICRLLNGMWQVSGAHGRIDPQAALQNMFDYLDAGFTTWDLADHYGPAEDFIGEFRQQLAAVRGADALANIQAFTKWVPRPGPMTRPIVEHNIAISLRRMGVDTLDLLQFHWWDYEDSAYLDALTHLSQLRDAGKLKHLALTNFDTAHVQTITEHGIRVVSNQVQYSLIDLRPEVRMVPFCQEQNIALPACSRLDDRKKSGLCQALEAQYMRGEVPLSALTPFMPASSSSSSVSGVSSSTVAPFVGPLIQPSVTCTSLRSARERAQCRVHARSKKK